MPSFSELFTEENPQVFTTGAMSDAPAPSTWFTPDKIRMLALAAGKIGSGMSEPGSFGRAAGDTAAQMAQAGATNKAMAMAGGKQAAPPPVAAPANPLEAAKHMKSYGKLIEDAFKVDPSLMPKGYIDAFSNALSTTSPPAEGMSSAVNPTAAPAPTPSVSQPIPETLAMTMSPEQVSGSYNYGLAAGSQRIAEQKQAIDTMMAPYEIANKQASTESAKALARHYDSTTNYQNWEKSPEGQAFKLKYAGEPTRMAHEMSLKKDELDRGLLEKAIVDTGLDTAKPDWLPTGIKSVGAFMRMSMLDKAGTTGVVSAFNSINDYKASLEIAKLRRAEIAENRASRDVEDDWKRLEAADRTAMQLRGKSRPEDFPDTPEGREGLNAARVFGTLMSPNDIAKIKEIDAKRKILMDKLKIPYADIPITGAEEKKIVVTQKDIEDRLHPRINTVAPYRAGSFGLPAPGSPEQVKSFKELMMGGGGT